MRLFVPRSTLFVRSLLIVTGIAALVVVAVNMAQPAEARSEDAPFVPLSIHPEPVPGPGVIGRTAPSVPQEWRVHAFAEANGRIFVGGAFTQVRFAPNGGATVVDQPYLAAFDLTTNAFISSFRPAIDDVVWALEVDDLGRLIVGGEFDSVNGTVREGLVALDPVTGAIDPSFTTSVANDGSNFEPSVRALSVIDDQLYVVGDFNRIVDDQSRHGAYRSGRVRTSDGRFDTSWRPLVSGGGVYDVAVDKARGQAVLVGTFTSVDLAPSTNGGALVDLASGSVVPDRAFSTNGFGNKTYGASVLGDTHFIGGEQHYFQGRAASDWSVRGFVNGGTLTAGEYVTSGHGGDVQFVDRVGDFVVYGCHCHGNIHSTFDNEFTWGNNRPIFIADSSGGRQNPLLELPFWNEGPYVAFGDSTGCLYVGGDFVGNVDGFGRFCPPSGTAAYVETPRFNVASDTGESVEFTGRVADRAGVSAVQLRVIDASGRYLRSNGSFADGVANLPAATSGIGASGAEASVLLPPLPAGQYTLEVRGVGGSGNATERSTFTVADVPEIVIGAHVAASNFDLVDTTPTTGVRRLRGLLLDPTAMGPQGVLTTGGITLAEPTNDLTADYLAGVDVVVVTRVSDSALTAAELEALQTWVEDGGVVVATAYNLSHNAVAEQFGATTSTNPTTTVYRRNDAEAGHTVNSGPFGSFFTAGGSGSYFTSVPAGFEVPIVDDAGRPAVVTGEVGSGYAVLMAGWLPHTMQGISPLGNIYADAFARAGALFDGSPEVAGPPDTQDPSGPLGPDATTNATSVTLTWNPSVDNVGVAGYLIHENYQYLAYVPGGNTTTWTHTGLDAGDEYRYQVRAQDAAGNTSIPSVRLDVIVGQGVDVPDNLPLNVSPTQLDATSIEVEWDRPTNPGGIRGYLVHDNYSYVAYVHGVDNHAYTHTGLTPGSTHRYEIRSQGNNITSLPTERVRIELD